MNIKRFKTYAPRNNEVAQWNAAELSKYYDIERMYISTSEKAFKDNKGFIKPKDYRTVVRKRDQMGEFKWIEKDLEEIAKQYSKDFDEVCLIFEQVNCDKKRLRERLEGNSFCSWKKIEDLTLKRYWECVQENGNDEARKSDHYQALLEEKGSAEIAARMRFLGYVAA